jgi:hypothetical protein
MAARADAAGDFLRRTTDLPSTTNLSICFWVCLRTDLNTFSPVWLMGASGSSYLQFGTNVDGTTLVWEHRSPDGLDPFITMMNMTVDTWYFVAGRANGASATFTAYWAAATAAALSTGSDTSGATPLNAPVEMSLFEETIFGGRSDAAVAAVKIWSGAQLTQAEFEAERWQYLPARTANLHLWSPLQDPGDATWIDYSGNARTWTEGGTVLVEPGPPIAWKAARRRRAYVPAAASGAPPSSVFPAFIQKRVPLQQRLGD